MTQTPDDSAKASLFLDDLLAVERLLDQRLAECRREAEEATERARADAEERVSQRRQLIARAEAERFEQGRRQFDDQLAGEMRQREAELASAMSLLAGVRQQLCARMLQDVLLLG